MENCEVWKDIPGYEGLYQVSNLGRVKSLDYHRTGKEKVLNPGTNHKGYLFVVLCKNGKTKNYAVHRLVGQIFISNPNNLPCINHRDECRINNIYTNLEWCTYSYNNNYGNRNKKALLTKKKNNSYTVERPIVQIDLNNIPVKIWNSISDAGRNGFSIGHISHCCHNKQKIHKGYKWMFFLPPSLPLNGETPGFNKEYK